MPAPGNNPSTHSRNLVLGIGSALASMFLFSTMDAVIKWMGANYPVHQLMFFRCTVALIPVLFILMHSGGIHVLKSRQPVLQVIRSALGVVAMGAAFYGFTTLPLADASSVFYTAPIMAMAFSVPILGEKVGIRRWTAVGVCMIGVLIIARPGGQVFNLGGLSMLMAAIMVGIISNILRKLNQTDEAVAITFYFTLTGAILTTVACLFLEWVPPTGSDWILLIAIGLLGGSAQYLMTLSFRYSAVSIIAPLRYLAIIIGGALGYIIWSEVPDSFTVLGITIIICSGIYSIHREAQLARASDRDGTDTATRADSAH